jgi:hypothetical protein
MSDASEHYARLPSFILGFHGCDQSLADDVFCGRTKDLRPSTNKHDWLGSGIYFWENNCKRALDWARSQVGKERRSGPTITHPAVIGAIIDPGNCLNFLDQTAMELAKDRFQKLADESHALGRCLPENRNPKDDQDSTDRIIRNLDCAVVESIHQLVKASKLPDFDTVRAVFLEGRALYPGAGFLERTHIQISVRNPAKILGYFRPKT